MKRHFFELFWTIEASRIHLEAAPGCHSRSRFAMSWCPLPSASCAGVSPSVSTAFGLALACSSSCHQLSSVCHQCVIRKQVPCHQDESFSSTYLKIGHAISSPKWPSIFLENLSIVLGKMLYDGLVSEACENDSLLSPLKTSLSFIFKERLPILNPLVSI